MNSQRIVRERAERNSNLAETEGEEEEEEEELFTFRPGISQLNSSVKLIWQILPQIRRRSDVERISNLFEFDTYHNRSRPIFAE